MVGLDFFIASFAIGVGGTGWLLQGEVFPTAVRGQAAAIGATVDWLANFALIEVFPVWRTPSASAGCWSASPACARWRSCSCGVPAGDQGPPVEEIVEIFERQQRSGPLGGSGKPATVTN